MSLTDEQIRQRVASMTMATESKERLVGQAIAGDQGARLVVFARFR